MRDALCITKIRFYRYMVVMYVFIQIHTYLYTHTPHESLLYTYIYVHTHRYTHVYTYFKLCFNLILRRLRQPKDVSIHLIFQSKEAYN